MNQQPSHPNIPRTVDHFSAAPWDAGERYYTVHVTFHEQHQLHEHAQAWRRVLAPYDQLDLVPDEWLHLTMQGLGRAGAVDQGQVEAIADRAGARLAKLSGFEVSVGDPVFTPDAVRFEPQPAAPVAGARRAVREAIGEIWPQVPERADGFVPHITAGYGNQDADARALVAAIEAAEIPPVTIEITHVDVILLGRDEGTYTWNLMRPMRLAD